MGRAPCCAKMGLKKGPWTPEEDRILIAHIQKHGHANWRALPKQAGLLRCGKSCRLRWVNYLNPDIKRGNFTKEEEDTIIKLHEMLGNRWSAIAARLPGRTDNEIKNVWHTHLKKRSMKQNQENNTDTKQQQNKITILESNVTSQSSESASSNFPANSGSFPTSPQPSSSDFSSVTDATQYTDVKDEQIESLEFPEIDESFWTEALSSDGNSRIMPSEFGGIINDEFQLLSPFASIDAMESGYDYSPKYDDDSMGFWYNILLTTGGESTSPVFQV